MLINDVIEFNKYLPVSVNFDDDKIAMFSAKVETESLAPIFSAEFIKYLIDNPGTIGTDGTRILESIKNACAGLSVVAMLDHNNVIISEGGVMVSEFQNKKIASEWRVKDARESSLRHASAAIESALSVLHSDPKNALFEIWKTKRYDTHLADRIIASSADWNSSSAMRINYFTYERLRHIIEESQEQRIPLILGESLYNKVLEAINDPQAADLYPEIIGAIRAYIAHITITKAYLDLHISLTESGLSISDTRTATGTIKRNAPAPDSNLDEFFRNHEQRAMQLENRIAKKCQRLFEEPDTRYAFWSESQFFVDPNATKPTPKTTTKRYFSGL